jgi:hypothetical protein
MRTILWLTVVVLVLVIAGVVTVNQSRGEVTMHLYTQTLERDAREVVNAGKQLLDRAERVLDSSGPRQLNRNRATNTILTKS